jgi:hypothetical protein
VLWQLKPGDFVLMQFGHNDSGPRDDQERRVPSGRRQLTGEQGQGLYLENHRGLMQERFITSPLSVMELFSITDIYVNNGEGVSLTLLKEWMPGYEWLSSRSCAFWGNSRANCSRRGVTRNWS